MEQKINIFCIVGKTGSGKNFYFDKIIQNKNLVKELNIAPLVYGTTRSIRDGEKDGTDYIFYTKEQYKNISNDDMIESRSYYTINDGTVHYFTTIDQFHIAHAKNIIAITSPYQYESYRTWIAKRNIIENNRYNLYLIYIDIELGKRINRTISRANEDDNKIYEMCRRVVEERNEFDSVCTRVPELIDPLTSKNVCYINNTSDKYDDIESNFNKISSFIRTKGE